jgi:hypothetical protein
MNLDTADVLPAAAPTSRNAAFIEKYAGPARIGLCGGRDWMTRLIRKAQAPLTADGHRSLWSHAFVFSERRIDGHWWMIESDVDRYFDDEAFPNLAILDFGLSDAQVLQVQRAGLDLLSGLVTYSITELMGTMLAMHSRRLRRRENLLAKDGALYCSAMVQHCYNAAGIEFLPGVQGKNIAPHDIDESPIPHQTHRLIRDLGISTPREAGHESSEWLRSLTE